MLLTVKDFLVSALISSTVSVVDQLKNRISVIVLQRKLSCLNRLLWSRNQINGYARPQMTCPPRNYLAHLAVCTLTP